MDDAVIQAQALSQWSRSLDVNRWFASIRERTTCAGHTNELKHPSMGGEAAVKDRTGAAWSWPSPECFLAIVDP